ncbi:MAG: hypothetical protein R2911_23460 [Caldilineaceae bacterium]
MENQIHGRMAIHELAPDMHDTPTHFTNEQLADLLHALDAPFVWGDAHRAPPIPTDWTALIVALAANREARLRLSLIPLFLRHASAAQYAKTAAAQLSGDALLCLRCYYTAAYFLQQVHRMRLEKIIGSFAPLPDLFSADLGLPTLGAAEARLRALAVQHGQLSGRALNWLGTYEHGAQQFMRYLEQKQAWQRSPSTISTRS